MALKKIRHAIFEWFDPDGTRHYAFRGQTVELPDHVVDAFEKFDAFESVVTDEQDDTGDDAPALVPSATPDAPVVPTAGEAPVKPNKTAPVKAWEDYAVALREFTGGAQGLTREDAEAATKQDLVELFA